MADIIIVTIIVAAVAGSVCFYIRRKKKGESSCGCGCSTCTHKCK